MKESEDEEERADFEEVLYENGPLIQTEHHNTKQLETVIKFLFEKMSLTENTLKRMQNKKKMTVLAERRATVLAQQAGRPGSSQGDKDQPPPPSPMKLASDAWAKCTTDTERLNCLFEMMQKTTASVEKMKAESIHNNAIQAAKDDAQDEMMQMEMDSMERKLASCLKHRDMKETLKIVEAEQQSQEANLKRMIMNNRREVSEELDQQLEKVFNQLRKISNSYEDQEKLLQTQIAEMVNQELTSPSFPAPAMQEKVIIREGKAHVVARPTTGSGVDASVLTKLKNSVAEMELSAANNSNLIERLNEQCEMASKRARESEDLVKALETQLVETTTTLESSLTEKVEEQAAQTRVAFAENEEKMEEKITAQKEQSSESFEMQIARISGQLKEDMKRMDAALTGGLGEVRESLSAKLSNYEAEQNDKIGTLVAEIIAEESSAENSPKQRIESLAIQTNDILAAIAEMKASQNDAEESNRELFEKRKEESDKHAAHLTDTLKSTVDKQFVEMRNNFSDLSGQTTSNNMGIKGLKMSLEKMEVGTATLIESFKKEQKAASLKLIEQSTQVKVNLTSAIADVKETLKNHMKETGDTLQNVEDESITMQNSIVDLNEELNKLATRENMWEQMEVKLQNHIKTISDQCSELEESVSSSKPTVMSQGMQRYLAGNCQRIAKLLATKADFFIIQRMVMHKNPVEMDWDEEVTRTREEFRVKFIDAIKEEAHKKHPITDFSIDEARQMFMMKLDLAIKVAISKYARIQIGTTILGRRQLVPTCMACDRPFNSNGATSNKDGDLRGVSRDPLPILDDDDVSIGSLGTIDSHSVMSQHSTKNKVVTYGIDQRKIDKFVFRAGFKIPKHISSPLIQELPPGSAGLNNLKYSSSDRSIGMNSTSSAGLQSNGNNNEDDYFANASIGGGIANRPHTVAFESATLGIAGGGGGGGGADKKREEDDLKQQRLQCFKTWRASWPK